MPARKTQKVRNEIPLLSRKPHWADPVYPEREFVIQRVEPNAPENAEDWGYIGGVVYRPSDWPKDTVFVPGIKIVNKLIDAVLVDIDTARIIQALYQDYDDARTNRIVAIEDICNPASYTVTVSLTTRPGTASYPVKDIEEKIREGLAKFLPTSLTFVASSIRCVVDDATAQHRPLKKYVQKQRASAEKKKKPYLFGRNAPR